MVDQLKREKVTSNVIQRANPAAQYAQSLRVAHQQQNNTSADIVNSLSRFTSVASDIGMREAQRKIEIDKVAGTNAAIRGQDIDDGSSRTKRMAYNLVNARKDLATTNAALKDSLDRDPLMKDTDYDKASTEGYDSLFAKYQDEPAIMKFLSVSAQESQLEMYSYRKQTQNKHQLEEDKTILSDRLNEISIDSDPDFIAEDIANWEQESQALGYGSDETRDVLTTQAQTYAASGDDGLLTYLEAQPWAAKNPNLKIARTAYNNIKTQEDFTGQADALNEIDSLVGDTTKSWDTIEALAVQTNEKYPNTFNGKQLAALHKKHDEGQKKSNDLRAGTVQTFNKSYIGLAKDGTITPTERGKRVKDAEAMFAQMAESLEPEALIKKQLAWTQHNEVKLPSLTTRFSAVPLLIADRELTDADEATLQLLGTAREQDIDFYMSGRTDAEYAKNIKKLYAQGGDAKGAILSATNLRDNRFNVTAETKAAVRGELDGAIDSEFDNFLASDIPDWNRNWILNNEMNNINTRLYNSADPTGLAASQAKLVKNRYTQLQDGTVGNYGIEELYLDLGYDGKATRETVLQTMDDAKDALAPTYAALGIDKEDFFIIKTEGGYAVRTSDTNFSDTQLLDGASLRMLGDRQQAKRLNKGKKDKKLIAEGMQALSDQSHYEYQ